MSFRKFLPIVIQWARFVNNAANYSIRSFGMKSVGFARIVSLRRATIENRLDCTCRYSDYLRMLVSPLGVDTHLKSRELVRSGSVEEAIIALKIDLLESGSSACCYSSNGYPHLIVIDPQQFKTKKEYLRTCKHEWSHAKNGASEQKAKRAEYRK